MAIVTNNADDQSKKPATKPEAIDPKALAEAVAKFASGHVREGYWDGYNTALADMAEDAHGQAPEYQRLLSQSVARLAEKEGKKRVMFADDLTTPATGQQLRPGNREVAIPDDSTAKSLAAATVSPEDRLLNAMAALVEEASGKDPQHQRAMADSAARISAAVKGINEIKASSKKPRLELPPAPPPDHRRIVI